MTNPAKQVWLITGAGRGLGVDIAQEALEAGTVGRQVGYASALQFTREYSRFYGVTPSRDMAQIQSGGA